MSSDDVRRARLNLAVALLAILTAIFDEIGSGRIGRDLEFYMLITAAMAVVGAWLNVKAQMAASFIWISTTITSTNNAAPGSGIVRNQIQYTYNSFGQLTEEQQEHSGSVSGSSPRCSVRDMKTGGHGTGTQRLCFIPAVPNRDIVLCTNGDSAEAVLKLRQIAKVQRVKEPVHGLTEALLAREEGRWVLFDGASGAV